LRTAVAGRLPLHGPPVIFVATNDAGRHWLAEKTGLQHGPLKATAFRNRDRMELDAKLRLRGCWVWRGGHVIHVGCRLV
jgi:hypothetical protein